MRKYLIKLSLIIVSIVMISCNSNDDEIEINDFKGFYKIKTILSSIPIDLNNDGVKSNDYLQEIKSNYISYNGEIVDYGYNNELAHNFAEARPTGNQTNNTQFLDIRFPAQRIDSIYQGNDDYVQMNMEYRKLYTGFIYKLTNNNIEIESDPINDMEFYDIKNFQINRIDKIEFEIFFDFKVYDFTENEWIETNLVGRYEKEEE